MYIYNTLFGGMTICYAGFLYVMWSTKGDRKSIAAQHATGAFPVFSDPSVMVAYRNYKNNYKGIGFVSLPRMIASITFASTRLNIFSGFWGGPLFATTAGLATLAMCMFALYILASSLVTYVNTKDPEGTNERLQGWKKFCLNYFLNGNMDESLALIRVVCIGLSLYARVVAGACPENTPFLDIAQCNPMAATRGLPVDHVLFLAFLPIIMPLSLKGMRFEATIFVWFVSVGWIFASILHLGGQLEAVTAIVIIVPLSVAFELERMLRLSFLNLELAEDRTKAMLLVRGWLSLPWVHYFVLTATIVGVACLIS